MFTAIAQFVRSVVSSLRFAASKPQTPDDYPFEPVAKSERGGTK